ncbi:MAG: hypothetical protein HC819_09030 [Cyclobacteriaceae bacterium]|nr:hypothetical protein [Cyclobacteriaceae bacterium]
MPTSDITLNSTISSANPITTYAWTKQSGPTATLANANTPTLSVSKLVEGTYIFRLTITDNKGSQVYDEVKVSVLPQEVNNAPKVDAGIDQVIVPPTNFVVIEGKGIDGDGSIVSYSWKR